MELIREKQFPGNYSDSVLDILARASMTGLKHVKVMGSAASRSQQYSGDYDAVDNVKIASFSEAAEALQDIVKRVREDCYITDFKIGEVPEWDVIVGEFVGGSGKGKSKPTRTEELLAKQRRDRAEAAARAAASAKKATAKVLAQIAAKDKPNPASVMMANLKRDVQSLYGKGLQRLNFKLPESLAKLDVLKKNKIISEAEYNGAERLLRAVKDPLSFVEARKGIRFHILRWKPMEVLDGIKVVRGLKVQLDDAIASGGLIKLDLIADLDQFTEVSMIYNLKLGKEQVTKIQGDVVESLREDIIYYDRRSPFKALKRAFSLAKLTKNFDELKKLLPLLNSDLGRLYNIVGDLATIHMLLETPSPPLDEIRENLDEMRARMGNIYTLKEFLGAESVILGTIESMKKMGLKKLKPSVYALHTELQQILNAETEARLAKLS